MGRSLEKGCEGCEATKGNDVVAACLTTVSVRSVFFFWKQQSDYKDNEDNNKITENKSFHNRCFSVFFFYFDFRRLFILCIC